MCGRERILLCQMKNKHILISWTDTFLILCLFPPSWSSCEWVGVDFGASCEPPLSPVFACLHYDTSLPLSVSAPSHQGGDSHHLPPGKWQSAEASPKKGRIASANLLVSTLFDVVLEDAECIRKWNIGNYKSCTAEYLPWWTSCDTCCDTCHPRLILNKW